MKKSIFFVLIMTLSLSASVFAVNSDPKATIPAKAENKLTEEQLNQMTRRVEQIRDMNKKELTKKEKSDLKKELKGIKQSAREGGAIYLGAGTLILIIILVILLL